MKTFEQMDDYEKEIAKALSTHFSHRYKEEEARKKVEEYYDVMDRVGWYWSPEEWAERLDHIIQQNISPEEWNKRIDQIDEYPDDPLTQQKNKPATLQQEVEELKALVSLLTNKVVSLEQRDWKLRAALLKLDEESLVEQLKRLGVPFKIIRQGRKLKDNEKAVEDFIIETLP